MNLTGGGRDGGRESPSSLCIPEERLPSLHSPPSQPRDPYGAAGEGGEKGRNGRPRKMQRRKKELNIL